MRTIIHLFKRERARNPSRRGPGRVSGPPAPRARPELGSGWARGDDGSRSRQGQRSGSGLVGLLLRDQPAHPLSAQDAVERLLEGIVEPEGVQLLPRLIAPATHAGRALLF